MNIIDKDIDGGKAFDWGRTSADYARFRDIYPQEFYDRIIGRNLCVEGQNVLDLGTGTGVLPRNMYRHGAKWTGTDISEEQIAQARILSEGMDITYYAAPAERIDFSDNAFDVVTACQCFWYFNHKKLALQYNPAWSGAGETMHPIVVPEIYRESFELTYHEEYFLQVPFTRESWHGRMKTCRGIGASLSEEDILSWEQEHISLLSEIAPEEFTILHYGAMAELTAYGHQAG
ncbi:MAG: class I SAM-dependent methyltransferase [Lachnospiraceae bacterium]|nr:class I SAM-dependent methyltransferase [Lachnospiraceae bacterium]